MRRKRKHLGDNKALKTIDYILGDKSKGGFSLPVDLRVGITPELKQTIYITVGILGGAIVLNQLIKQFNSKN